MKNFLFATTALTALGALSVAQASTPSPATAVKAPSAVVAPKALPSPVTAPAATAAASSLVATPSLGGKTVSVYVSGYSKQDLGTAEQDADYTTTVKGSEFADFDLKGETALTFTGEANLSQDVKGGAVVTLNVSNGDGVGGSSQFERAFGFVESEGGRLSLGRVESASELGAVFAPNVVGSLNESDILNGRWVARPDVFKEGFTSTLANRDGKAEKILFTSSRFSGFQVLASYTPQYLVGNYDMLTNSAAPGNRGLLNYGVLNGSGNNPLAIKNTVSGSINYSQQMNDVALDASIGASTSLTDKAVSADQPSHGSLTDMTAGLRISYAGLSLGGSVMKSDENNVVVPKTITAGTPPVIEPNPNYNPSVAFNKTGFAWESGLAYENGKVGMSLNTFQSEASSGTSFSSGKAKQQVYQLGGKVNVNSGLAFVASLFHADFQGPDSTKAEENNKGYGATVGLRLNF